jgi:membrane protease YdiL (CAAX protease family)
MMKYHVTLYDDIESRVVLLFSTAVLCLAELLNFFNLPLQSAVIHSVNLQILLLLGAYRWGRPQSLSLALAIPSLIRLVGFALPLADLSPIFAQWVISIPLFLMLAVFVWLFQLPWFNWHIMWSSVPHYVWITAVGLLAGGILYQALPPTPLPADSLWLMFFNLFVVIICMAFLEEWLFRGVMQGLLTEMLRQRWLAGVLVAVGYTLLHLGHGRVTYVLLILILSLFLSWLRTISRSLFPVCLLHAAANLTYYILLPWFFA